LGYLFGPPGWSHDGSRLTSEELRALEEDKSAASTSEFLEPKAIPA